VSPGASPDWIILVQASSWDTVVKISLAALLGAVVGLERVSGGHPAGLRTNMLIAISSCLFTILSVEGFPVHGSTQDTARVAAQIVTGVGFLGAGVLLQARGHVHGLTTAASIWLVAAVGMAVGVGLYFEAVFTVILSMVLLVALAPVSRRLERQALQHSEMRPVDRDGEVEQMDKQESKFRARSNP
jgi:putative Mg2+ transporter-C (MgtC) family protein